MATTSVRPPLVAAYPDAELIRRMKRIRRMKPRYTISKIISHCLERELPNLESELGLSPTGASHPLTTGR